MNTDKRNSSEENSRPDHNQFDPSVDDDLQNKSQQNRAAPKNTSEEEKQQRAWEDAKKQQQQNATRPGIDIDDMAQHDEQGNAKDIE